MNKKELTLPFVVIGLSILFAGICVAVFFSNGKSKKWVARKMKVGGLLLSLTAITTVGGPGCCYKPDDNYPRIQFDNSYYNSTSNEININLDTGNVIKATLLPYGHQDFSFSIDNENEEIIQKGAIRIADGTIDSYSEAIEVEIDQNIATGIYYLSFFRQEASMQESTPPFDGVKLNIIDIK